jgi:hypothetical protein
MGDREPAVGRHGTPRLPTATWTVSQAHGRRGGVPAAGSEPAEDRGARRGVVEMERPGIELGGEGLDAVRVDAKRARPERLADGVVLAR